MHVPRVFRLRRRRTLTALLPLLLGAAQAAQAGGYTISGLGFLGTDPSGAGYSLATAFNDAGQVAGYSYVNNNSSNVEAFRYGGGTLTGLGSLGTDRSGDGSTFATSINGAGQIAGYGYVANNSGNLEAFRYSGGTLTGLGSLGTDSSGSGNSDAVAINSAGTVTGASDVYDSSHNPKGTDVFLSTDGGPLADIGNPSGGSGNSFSSAVGINDNGQVAGNAAYRDAATGSFVESAAFVYDSRTGKSTLVGNYGPDANGVGYSVATGINSQGEVIGYSDSFDAQGDETAQTAFLYSHGALTNLGSLGKDSTGYGTSDATGINSEGEVVGNSVTSDGSYDAFLYSGGGLQDLGHFGNDANGHGHSYAIGINDAGQVVGYSYVNNDPTHTDTFLYSNGTLTDLSRQLTDGAGWSDLTPIGISSTGMIYGNGTFDGSTEAFVISADAGPADGSSAPEPASGATLTLIFTGLAGLLIRARRRGGR